MYYHIEEWLSKNNVPFLNKNDIINDWNELSDSESEDSMPVKKTTINRISSFGSIGIKFLRNNIFRKPFICKQKFLKWV